MLNMGDAQPTSQMCCGICHISYTYDKRKKGRKMKSRFYGFRAPTMNIGNTLANLTAEPGFVDTIPVFDERTQSVISVEISFKARHLRALEDIKDVVLSGVLMNTHGTTAVLLDNGLCAILRRSRYGFDVKGVVAESKVTTDTVDNIYEVGESEVISLRKEVAYA